MDFTILICKTLKQYNVICLDLDIWTCVSKIEDAEEYIRDAILFSLEDCAIENFEPADIYYWKLAIKSLITNNPNYKVIRMKL